MTDVNPLAMKPRVPERASDLDNDSGVAGATVADALDTLNADKQPLDATLTALAALSISANSLVIGTGTDAFSITAFAANTFPARASTGDLVAKPITDFGLSLVDDVDAAAARTTLGLGTVATLPIDTDGTLAANSDSVIATQKATKTYVDNAVTGLLDFKGSTDCSANPNYPAALKGDAYVVTVAGKIGGASGKSVDVGDMYLAIADNAGGTEASVGTSWSVLEHNLVGAVLSGGALGTPSSGTLTNCTGLPVGGISGLGTGVATALGVNVGSAGSPVVNGGALGTPASGTVTNLTGTASININGTVGATTPAAGTFTDLTANGNTIIGDASGDTLTVNAAAWSTPNAVTVTKTAQASTAETLMTWKVSDDATGKFEILNGTATDGLFSPQFKGTRAAAGTGVTFVGNGTTDTGSNPLILFNATIADGAVATRPLVQFANNNNPGMELSVGYNLQLKGGATSPALVGATADIASLAGVDRLNTRHAAAGNRALGIQTERGSAIYVGDDAIDFAAATAIVSVNNTDITITSTTIDLPQKITTYGGMATSGHGVAAVRAHQATTGATSAIATLTAVTIGADASVVIDASVLVTASGTHNFTMTVAYTDVGGTARTLTLNFSNLAGTIAPAITNAGGAVPYHGISVCLRTKGSTSITVATTGTFTSVTYNATATITQIG